MVHKWAQYKKSSVQSQKEASEEEKGEHKIGHVGSGVLEASLGEDGGKSDEEGESELKKVGIVENEAKKRMSDDIFILIDYFNGFD